MKHSRLELCIGLFRPSDLQRQGCVCAGFTSVYERMHVCSRLMRRKTYVFVRGAIDAILPAGRSALSSEGVGFSCHRNRIQTSDGIGVLLAP